MFKAFINLMLTYLFSQFNNSLNNKTQQNYQKRKILKNGKGINMAQNNNFKRSLSNNQIQLIALGGTIGTGLFLGVGGSIKKAGPAIILIYALVGFFLFLMMRALGELILSDLEKHTYTDFITKYLGERIGLSSGYLCWLAYITLAMAEMTALGIYFQFWFPKMPLWLPGTVTVLILLSINIISAKIFGNFEFSFAILKILTVLCFVAFITFMALFSKKTYFGAIFLSNMYKYRGFFPNGLHGFLEGIQMAIFSFVGIEMIGFTACESKDPKKIMPKAINQMPIRIILFYILAILSILAVIPWNKIAISYSPFVQVLNVVGIKNSASFFNFVVITAAVSSTNSIIYSSGRLLFSLCYGREGRWNKTMGHISRNMLPQSALIFSALMIALAPVLILLIGNDAFNFISAVTTSIFLLMWIIMLITHLVYVKTDRKDLTFKLPLAPFSDYVLIAFFSLVVLILLFLKSTRVPMLVAIVVSILLSFSLKLQDINFLKTKVKK